MPDKKLPKEAVEALEKKARRFHNLFTSPDGKRVMRDLENEFDLDELKGQTPHDSFHNVGRRDVITYIRQLIRYQENVTRAELEG